MNASTKTTENAADTHPLRLVRKGDSVHALTGNPDTDEKPVHIVWARPVTGMGREISILGADKKEVALLKSLDSLDPHSREIAAQELRLRYLAPVIRRVIRTRSHFGSRYWIVETDHGQRQFLIKEPHRSVLWVTPDQLLIRDTLGNRYRIESLRALDDVSRGHIERIV